MDEFQKRYVKISQAQKVHAIYLDEIEKKKTGNTKMMGVGQDPGSFWTAKEQKSF